jgi:hypothetical protein
MMPIPLARFTIQVGSDFAPIWALLMCYRCSGHPIIEVLEKSIVLSTRLGEA